MRAERWGYITVNGETAIKPQYVSAMSFTENRARVWIDGTWGFIGTDGELIVKPVYRWA